VSESTSGIPITHNKITVPKLLQMKERGEKIVALSIYTASPARIFEEEGGHVIIIGDSAAMTQQGDPNTKGMTMDEMIRYSKNIRNGTKRIFKVCDMPLGSYEFSDHDALRNACRFMQEADGNAVKIEINKGHLPQVKALMDFCPVVTHVGLNPNKMEMYGGYRTFGKDLDSVKDLCDLVRECDQLGVCMTLLESVTEEVAAAIQKMVKHPVIGIAAGRYLAGQLVISDDLLGLYKWGDGNAPPRHFKTHKAMAAGVSVADLTREAFRWHVKSVQDGTFPGEDNVHHLPPKTRDEIMKYLEGELRGVTQAA
jgi:3-methyl-2-oxobutanoate hydroxymethyltransferase